MMNVGHFEWNRQTFARCRHHFGELGWRDRLSLLLASALGVALFVLLSPVFAAAGVWALATRKDAHLPART